MLALEESWDQGYENVTHSECIKGLADLLGNERSSETKIGIVS